MSELNCDALSLLLEQTVIFGIRIKRAMAILSVPSSHLTFIYHLNSD